ncbi:MULTISPECIES: TetR/AcrR family transcriptional regulator [Bacillus]|uniref:HTH tetR-type domain-containing protein n=2 Tax=Bacillus TaxID=1386 RepID=A0A0M5JET2_9BACI|nr:MULTISPECIES: TetR/AcrR family transcriptional regulator [Bacillus]ALC82314.1 hypothetical protein AM592_12525 [Bacillus gobiensis]MBP1081177.1 AcrR family transcriptional regulator [Bacillus capparidis]MED1095859.1 TetR/AcrR family transcriptional regulator [Bacillus capparidis]
MKQKEISIINQAIKLFAEKGYKTTSVQEIADECGISKGAFYIYFKSKDALLVSILEYYYHKVFTRIDELKTSHLPPKEVYRKQLAVYYENILEHQDFITMQMKEKSMPDNKDIRTIANQFKATSLELHTQNVKHIYGEGIAPYLADICLLIEGLTHVYLELIILYKLPLEISRLTSTIVDRVDDLVQGMIRRNEKPLVTNLTASSLFEWPDMEHKPGHSMIKKIKEKASRLPDRSHHQEIMESLELLENELRHPTPRTAIIKGMIANLKAVDEIKGEAEMLDHLINERKNGSNFI